MLTPARATRTAKPPSRAAMLGRDVHALMHRKLHRDRRTHTHTKKKNATNLPRTGLVGTYTKKTHMRARAYRRYIVIVMVDTEMIPTGMLQETDA